MAVYQLIIKTLEEWDAPFVVDLSNHFEAIELYPLSEDYIVLKVNKEYEKPLHCYSDIVKFVRNNQDKIHKALITSNDSDMLEKANFLNNYYQVEGLITDIDYSTLEDYYHGLMEDLIYLDEFTLVLLETREFILPDISDYW